MEERERAAAFLEEAAVVRRREDDRRVRVDNMIVLCLNALDNGKWRFNFNNARESLFLCFCCFKW